MESSDSPINRKRRRKAEKMYASYRRSFRGIREMEAKEALRLQDQNRVVFVDVRDPAEQVVSMLPGALTEAEYLKAPQRFRKKIVLCYCTIGYRSGLFVKKYGSRYPNLYNLSGGLILWLHAGGTMEKDGSGILRVHVYGRKWALQPEGYVPVY